MTHTTMVSAKLLCPDTSILTADMLTPDQFGQWLSNYYLNQSRNPIDWFVTHYLNVAVGDPSPPFTAVTFSQEVIAPLLERNK